MERLRNVVIDLSNEILDEKCCKKRGVKRCLDCIRYKECKTGKHYLNEEGVIRLVGVCIRSALEDDDKIVPTLASCKNQSRRDRRRNIIYHKMTTENFFKSRLFQLTQMDASYLREAYQREKERCANEEKIYQRGHRFIKNQKD